MRVLDPSHRITTLDPRVEEGACVPDLTCWLSVWVAGESVSVQIRPLAGVRVVASPTPSSNGLARFPLVVAGNEGRVEVEALDDDGVVVAAREVRLPVVPGGIVARASTVDGRIEVEWDQLGGRTPVLVDVFQGRRWMHAFSLSPRILTCRVSAPASGGFRFVRTFSRTIRPACRTRSSSIRMDRVRCDRPPTPFWRRRTTMGSTRLRWRSSRARLPRPLRTTSGAPCLPSRAPTSSR